MLNIIKSNLENDIILTRDAIYADLMRFKADTPRKDDITLMAVELHRIGNGGGFTI